MPDVQDRRTPEQVKEFEDECQEARAKLKSSYCNKCGQPITQEEWTRKSLETMAEKANANLAVAYAYCYLEPTFHSHATAFGLEARLRETESGCTFEENAEQEAGKAVLYGHGLVLRLLKLQNSYFGLGLDAEIDARWEMFPKIWKGHTAAESGKAESAQTLEQKAKTNTTESACEASSPVSACEGLPEIPRDSMESSSPSEDEFRRRIYERYKEHFDHFYNLHQLAEWALIEYGATTKDKYHAALQLILPRALKSFDSIRRLCEIASCEDAAVILRSLLNLLAVTRWISADSKKRAKKYLAWYWVQMHRDAEFFNDVVPSEFIVDIEKHYNRVKPQFEYKDGNGNIKMPKNWYQPEVNSIFEMFKEVGLEKQYREGYKPLSGIEHSDCMSYFAMLREAERSDGKTQLAVQSDLFVPHYLRNAFQYFADIFRICNQTMALADSKNFEGLVATGISFYKADMKARGIHP